MKNILLLIIVSVFFNLQTKAQSKFFTRSGIITLFSETPFENIVAKNNQITGAIDIVKNEVAFVAAIKMFVFKNGLMQEHFNENYMESEKIPRAFFKGHFTSDINLNIKGEQTVNIDGEMTIHGVVKKIKFPTTIEVKGGKLYTNSKIDIAPEDYKIEIPALVRNKIAKKVTITIYSILEPFQ